MNEGRPNIVDLIINNQVSLIINTTVGKQTIKDSFSIRRSALERNIPYTTTIRGAAAVTKAIESMKRNNIEVKPIQQFYK
jgi:carbamoyl-phosphate synthase large subunit